MFILKSLYNTILEALFPVSPEEQEVLAMNKEQAFETLSKTEERVIPEASGIFSYKDERVRKLIWSIKYKKSAHGTNVAGYALYRTISTYYKDITPIIVVPMPITPRRRRERGFNQCELLIDEIEKLDTDHHLTISRNILYRKLHKSRQTMKDRKERLESAQNIFFADNEAIEKLKIDKTQNYLIIVIDDVITTGSTMKEAINTLRKAGLEKTFGLSVAH
ncbi:MAG: hypothetical protein WC666_04575 [Candidatus Paceibacterota bacterium]|jgi:ComF family protein